MAYMKLSNSDTYGQLNRYYSTQSAGIRLPETSYSNNGGSGDRTSLIDITYGGGWYRANPITNLIDGSLGTFIAVNNAVSTSGCYLTFDFKVGNKVFIDSLKFYTTAITSYGFWNIIGSDDNSTWSSYLCDDTEIVNGSTVNPVIFNLYKNLNSYRYYKMIGISGTFGDDLYWPEVEFKINDVL